MKSEKLTKKFQETLLFIKLGLWIVWFLLAFLLGVPVIRGQVVSFDRRMEPPFMCRMTAATTSP